jgi:hypothetical protein
MSSLRPLFVALLAALPSLAGCLSNGPSAGCTTCVNSAAPSDVLPGSVVHYAINGAAHDTALPVGRNAHPKIGCTMSLWGTGAISQDGRKIAGDTSTMRTEVTLACTDENGMVLEGHIELGDLRMEGVGTSRYTGKELSFQLTTRDGRDWCRTTYDDTRIILTMEEAIGGAAAGEKLVTPNFRRVLRIQIDTTGATTDSSGQCGSTPPALILDARISQTAADYSTHEIECGCNG